MQFSFKKYVNYKAKSDIYARGVKDKHKAYEYHTTLVAKQRVIYIDIKRVDARQFN